MSRAQGSARPPINQAGDARLLTFEARETELFDEINDSARPVVFHYSPLCDCESCVEWRSQTGSLYLVDREDIERQIQEEEKNRKARQGWRRRPVAGSD